MKLRRFVAPDTRTAMQQIKAELGPEAVILSSSKVDGGVEVVAAIDFDQSMISEKAAIATAEPASLRNDFSQPVLPRDDMMQEILTLRKMVETQLQSVSHSSPLHAVLLQKLQQIGISQKTARLLLKDINPQWNQKQAWESVIHYLSSLIPIKDNQRIEEGGIFAFVGPTGVGKTTTLAKIAARFVLRFGAENLGLVTMDTYRIAAQEQLLMYGKILGVKVMIAQDDASLTRVLQQLNDKKLILIDTAGMNPADIRMQQQMDMLTSRLQSISTVLVLPATSHYQVIIDAIRCYQAQKVEECIITKLDESKAIGGILSAVIESGVLVSYLTHGQRVPEDIKMATRHQLTELFLEQDTQVEQEGCSIV